MRTDKVKWTELITGILLILLGIYSLIRPVGMLTGVTIIYGLFAVITGIADIAFYVRMERRTGFGPAVSLVTGILSVLAGILILCNISAAGGRSRFCSRSGSSRTAYRGCPIFP